MPLTYVGDVVRATIAACVAEVANLGAVINVASGHSTSLSTVLDVAERLTGHPVAVERVGARAGDVPATLADITQARDLLAWKPEVSLTDGMKQQLRRLKESA
ncbi:Rossmann-fold NAD(P)-binding domain-containing protein [Streptomyces justiciae]|uniref:hypothetical protein n=1 Tax=Streptomyces justiciae TaxID=2780140 RepID=UPI001882D51F|nr:hypothetical protein [Streptomyces justiciae]MBE8477513.1 hypothetical protein [Streptomyces justiciae]